jgi:hypothetical protein
MPFQIIYAAIMALGCLYIFSASQQTGRYAAMLIAGSALVFWALGLGLDWKETAQAILWADLLVGAAFGALVVRSQLNWLVHCGGLQLAKIATHLATIITPNYSPALYQALLETWMILILASAAWGVWLQRQKPQ